MKSLERRKLLKFSALGFAFLMARGALAEPLKAGFVSKSLADFVLKNINDNPGNFHAIYDNEILKSQFLSFLENVYNIYPEQELHALITEASILQTDKEIYNEIFARIGEVKPLLSEFRYAIPALSKQKKEITNQTLELLEDQKTIDGYLEIGTPGRYISELEDVLEIKGKAFLLDKVEPKYSPLDIVERGQITKIADFVSLNDYAPISNSIIEEGSLDLVTNYIGFHHSPLEKLEDFVMSINRVLKKGGSLILREHNVINSDMNHMVALAHDVFNVGLKVDWKTNHQEIRNFRTIENWVSYLEKRGFKFQEKILFQKGDPTKNGLMKFVKVA
jgi:SAM-dependent methyltransferase